MKLYNFIKNRCLTIASFSEAPIDSRLFPACGVERGQSYSNIEDNWRFLPADKSPPVDAPAITRRPPSWSTWHGPIDVPHRTELIGELVRPGYRDIPTDLLWPHMAQVSSLGPELFVRESTEAI